MEEMPSGSLAPIGSLRDLVRRLAGGSDEATMAIAEVGSDRPAALQTLDAAPWPSAQTPQPRAPIQPPAAARDESVSRETPPGENRADTSAAPPPPGGAAEVDMEAILDTLTRSVAEEYRRFYGS